MNSFSSMVGKWKIYNHPPKVSCESLCIVAGKLYGKRRSVTSHIFAKSIEHFNQGGAST